MAIAKRKRPTADSVRPAMQQRSREKRDRLIKAGTAAFARRGYEQARVADIAREAGISVGVFYQRFKDKRGFFDALEAEFMRQGRENWDRFIERADPAWTAQQFLVTLMAGLGRTISNNMGFFRALITLGHHDKSVVDPAVELDMYGAQRLEAYLIERKYVTAKQLRENQVYFALASAMKTLLVMAANDVGPYRATDQATAEELARMFAGYVGIRLS
ncbi:MAG: TetR/AcrR family transcriptional regulator [Pseudomonadales bacterium]